MTKKVLYLIFTSFVFLGFTQQSTPFQIWFKLFDKQGKVISPEQFKNIELYASQKGYLMYNAEKECYVLKQYSPQNIETIVLIQSTDTTVIIVPARTFYAGGIQLIDGFFNMQLDMENGKFDSNNVIDLFPNSPMFSCTQAFYTYQMFEKTPKYCPNLKLFQKMNLEL